MNAAAPPCLAFVETVADCEQLERYVATGKFQRSDVIIIALAVSTEEWLTKNSWRFCVLDNLFDLSSRVSEIWTESVRRGENWFKALSLDDYYYEHVAIPDFRRFFMHALGCQLVLENVLPQYPNCRVLLLPSNQVPLTHYFGYLQQRPSNGVFSAILRWHCRRHSIPTVDLQDRSLIKDQIRRFHPWVSICAKLFGQLPRPWRAARRLFKKCSMAFLEHTRVSSHRISSGTYANHRGRADVMITNWGYDMERNMRLDEVVKYPDLSALRIVHVCHGPEMRPDSLPPQHTLRFYSDTRIPAMRRLAYVWQFVFGIFFKRWRGFQRYRNQLALEFGEFLASSELNFQFLHWFFDLYNLIHYHRCKIEALLHQYTPRVFITSDVDTVDLRAHVLAAEEFGAITLTTNHGFCLYAPPASNFLAQYCLVGGPALEQNLRKGGVSENRIHIIGNPSFDRIQSHCSVIHTGRTRIIVVTAGFDVWSGQYRTREYLRSLEVLAENLSANGSWQIVIKSHPIIDMYASYDAIIGKLNRPNLCHIRKSWKRQEFRSVDVAVCIGNLSGSTLELQSFGIPIVYLQGFTADAPWHCYDGCGVIVRSAKEIVEVVRRLVSEPNYYDIIAARGFSFLQRYTNVPNNSLKLFSDMLQRILKQDNAAMVEAFFSV